MSREVRRVARDWHHPKDERTGKFKPMFEGAAYASRAAEFLEVLNSKGLQEAIEDCGNPPDKEEYMPDWAESEMTHLMMYETTSEGTPISPAFATPEELATWLVENNASAFAGQTASYEAWLKVAKGAYACSAIYSPEKGMMSGVEALQVLNTNN